MKKFILIYLLLPLTVLSQEHPPFVEVQNGSINFYVSAGPESFRQLPSYKPGFVTIIQTSLPQIQTTGKIIESLTNDLEKMVRQNLSTEQKQEFLEKYACLVLLKYESLSQLNAEYLSLASRMKEDSNLKVRSDAEQVVKMAEMYLSEIQREQQKK
jgi:hypothetical protein